MNWIGYDVAALLWIVFQAERWNTEGIESVDKQSGLKYYKT